MTCPICYDDLTDDMTYKIECKHTFHQKCIMLWLVNHNNCPCCRQQPNTNIHDLLSLADKIKQKIGIACEKGELDTIKRFYQIIPDTIRHNTNQILWYASIYGHFPIVEYLCKTFPPGTMYGVKLEHESQFSCVICAALQKGHKVVGDYLEVVKLLFDLELD